ncbi:MULTISPECIES: hypothetical protein [unclassified Sphingomonas]|jgi:hypothetical protein|uniref:hypothetical protein n=1 Tax=unclassified Sphingomonas TaxID=196159 RepID=UPI00082A5405|nr:MULTISPECIES: hypothetical protein [unclassified Sphingomonas]MCH4894200.1 hypothetical protein [Sphingomonas sp. SFZ2018-12]
MLKPITGAIAAAAAFAAVPAMAGHDRYAHIFNDSNSHYLDYKTSISEAKRELRKDLEDADSESDRVEAYAEYEREVADADYDFRKEMAERGVKLRRGEVTVLEDVAAIRR